MSLRPRLMSLLVRPTPPPTWLGVVVAAGCITAETLLVFVLRRLAPENTFGALFLLGVLVVSAGWELRLAVITTLASALAYIYFHLAPNGGFMPLEECAGGRDLRTHRVPGERPCRPGAPARR